MLWSQELSGYVLPLFIGLRGPGLGNPWFLQQKEDFTKETRDRPRNMVIDVIFFMKQGDFTGIN